MKKFFLMLVTGAVLSGALFEPAGAKSYLSKSYEDKYQRLGDREAKSMMRRMGISGDDEEFTLSDLKNMKLSRREEKEIRAAKKNGTYKTPEEQFKEMDANRDGKVNSAELQEYYARQAYREEPSKKDRNPDVSQYGKPLPELTPEQEALHDEMIAKAVAAEAEIKDINENPALTSSEKEEKIKEVKEKYYPEEKTAETPAGEKVTGSVAGDDMQSERKDNAVEAEDKSKSAEDGKPEEKASVVKDDVAAGENVGVSAEKTTEGDGLQESGENAGNEVPDGMKLPGL